MLWRTRPYGSIDRRDPSVGVAQQPAAILDGAHARHVQVLPGRAGVAVPSVVADVHEDFGAVARELAHLVGENSFIADEDAVAMPPAVLRIEQKDSVVACHA